MDILLNAFYIIAGVAATLWGADRFTDGAGQIARNFRIPEIVIGLTIVSFGTSAPELFTSLVSSLKGANGLALGNVIGSNIFNTLLIVGLSALVSPIAIMPNSIRKDIPCALASTIMLILLCLDKSLSRLDALLLFAGFLAFLFYTLHLAKKGRKAEHEPSDAAPHLSLPHVPLWKSMAFIIVGLACLILGSNFFVEGASFIAAKLGVSEALIGLTVVAMGTSFPELATSVISARKGQSGIAIGNVIGSNIFNILMILGITGTISPLLNLGGITYVDLVMLLVSMVLLWGMSYTRYKIERWEGALLTLLFFLYLSWLVYQAV